MHVRTLVVLSTVVIAMLVGLGAWAQHLLRQSFERLEATEAAEEVQLALQRFDDRCVVLTTAAVAWSQWSSAETDLSLAVAPLPGEASALFELHLGDSVPDIGRMALSDALPVRHIPVLMEAVLAKDAPRELGTNGRVLVRLDDGLVLVVWSNRVLPDGGIGAVVAGRRLDEQWIGTFGDGIRHQVRLRPWAEVSLSDAALRQLDGPEGMVLQPGDDEELLAHGRIDLAGGPLVVTLSLDRGIVAAGDLTWDILITAIAFTGGILVVAVLLLLDRFRARPRPAQRSATWGARLAQRWRDVRSRRSGAGDPWFRGRIDTLPRHNQPQRHGGPALPLRCGRPGGGSDRH